MRGQAMRLELLYTAVVAAALNVVSLPAFGADEALLKPRVPVEHIGEA